MQIVVIPNFRSFVDIFDSLTEILLERKKKKGKDKQEEAGILLHKTTSHTHTFVLNFKMLVEAISEKFATEVNLERKKNG